MKHGHEEVTTTCEGCGASIYQQHLDSGIARYEGGKLLCSHCVEEFERAHESGDAEVDFEPIALEAHEDSGGADTGPDKGSSRIHALSAATLGAAGAWNDAKFKRPLDPKATGASRCRTFHCKLSEGSIDFFNNQVNEWLEANPKISIKFAASTIGMFEGKHTEPNLIMTVFY